jgi:GrpB-like predicted nucleotidyltransferase (UPF0157 family)
MRIHHIGSTAVPGLAAKPIIDILVEVSSLAEIDATTDGMAELGYEAMGEFGIAGRRYFHKGGNQRTHQIHAFKKGNPHILRHIVFRDYLRTHPDAASEYGRLKKKVAATCDNDIEVYCDGKEAYVKKLEAIAMKEKK